MFVRHWPARIKREAGDAIRWLRPLPLGVLLLTLSALILVGPARDSMSMGTALLVLLHIGLGFLLTLPLGILLWRAWRQASVTEEANRRAGLPLLAMFGGACALAGFLLFLHAARGQSAAKNAFLWWMHLLTGFGAVLFFLLRSTLLSRKRSLSSAASASPSLALILVVFLAAPGALWATADRLQYPAEFLYRDLTATTPEQAQNPRFPAGMRFAEGIGDTTAAARWQEAQPEYCGRNGCHPTLYREWLSSAHRAAGSDPFYQRVRAEYAARRDPAHTRWCTGCHEPQRLLTDGKTERTADGALSPGAQKRDWGRETQASGVDCIACHASVETPARLGNGRFTLALPQNYPFANRRSGWQRRLHEFLLRVRPAPHQHAFSRPEWHRSAEACAVCHRQSFNVPQNHYQFVSGPDPYGEWQSGPASGRAARSAGLTTSSPQNCADCHFPRQAGGHIPHATPGGNTALPALASDTSHVARTEAFLRQNRITLDLFALQRVSKRSGEAPWIAPLESPLSPVALKPGEEVALDIVVRNEGVGHNFPGGYEDLREAWLEVTLEDAAGRVLLENGVVRSDSESPAADAHIYRLIALDRAGSVLTRHNLTEQVATVMRRSLPPGGSEIARYRFALPSTDSQGRPLTIPLRLHARLRYRALNPGFARWAQGESVVLPSPLTLAETTVPLPLSGGPAERGDAAIALRFVHYGVGLLASREARELARATRAFQMARTLAPDRPEPYLALGRAYLREPALLEARTQFEEALRRDPRNAAARAGLGLVFSKQGVYDRALELLQPLAQAFPQDSELLRDLGATYLQQGSYAQAAEAFQQALAANPNDETAHFKLQQCYKHLRRITEARREEAIGRYLNEDPQVGGWRDNFVREFLRRHPEWQSAARPLPEHRLHPWQKRGANTGNEKQTKK